MTTPLTGLQEALWLGRNPSFELGNVGSRRYLEADLADVDLDRLQRAWNAVVARHPALRMTITSDGKAQLTPEPAEYRIAVHDLRAMPEPEQQEQLDQVRNAMCAAIGDPTSWPLFEVRVSLLGGNRARLHVDLDLVTIDEDGIAELGRDLRRSYTGAAPTPELPELPAAPALPLATEPGTIKEPRFVRRERALPRIAFQELKERARAKGIGVEAVLAASFGEVIANWSKEWSFTISIARPDSRLGVGNPTSIMPLAMDASLQRPFAERAGEVQARLAAATAAYGADGIEVVRELNRTGRRLAPALPVVFMPRLSEGTQDNRDWALGSGSVGYELTRLPQVSLAHEVADIEGELRVAWHAVDALFPPGLLDHLVDSHLILLSALAASSDRWDKPSPESVPQNQQTIRERTNDTATELPDVLLHELFWNQAATTPDAPAVIAEQRTLTFREVRAGADALATQLIALGARPNRMVAIVMEKGWEQPVAVMGILESGAAYVPIEPDLPEERFHYLLQHAEVELALVQPHLAESLPWPDGVRRIVVDEEVLRAEGRHAPRRIQTQRDMAYVIYTSGSTGLPKGVMIDHRGALNTVLDINRRFGVTAEDRVLALTPLSFDLSVYDLFGPFAVGGAMVMPSAGTARAPWHWAAIVEQHHVTLWNTVPALMEMLAGYAIGRRERIADSLRLVLMSGDWIAVTLPDRIRSLSGPEIEIVNLGGATEASIWSVYYRIGEVDPSWSSIPYGKPLANQSIEVLDGALRRRPDWVPGEQYIGGFGVAMGYWRDEEKTSRAFIKHPHTGARLYRTGDLGRYFPDGNVEFLGREDFQVKIHGYRIELGEIEAALLSHDLVTASVVTAIGSARGEKRLVAYVTVTAQPDQDRDTLQSLIINYLAGKLPAHMVPGHLMILDQLPLTPNSKIDRKALPLPQLGRKGGQSGAEPELTVLESRLLAIWQEQLSEKIDVKEDPFELGADSIMAARVHRRISDELSAAVKLDDVLLARSVRALAAALAEN